MVILLVDDEPIMCRSIAAVLHATGQPYTIEQFSGKHCGSAALNWLEYNEPDYCILDVLLNGVSGIDVANKIIHKYPNSKILLMTGCASDSDYYNKTLEYVSNKANVKHLLKRETSLDGTTTFIGSILEDLSGANE